MVIASLLKTTEQLWRDQNEIDKMLQMCYNSISQFQHGYNLTDLAVAKSYLDQVYYTYLDKEMSNGEAVESDRRASIKAAKERRAMDERAVGQGTWGKHSDGNRR